MVIWGGVSWFKESILPGRVSDISHVRPLQTIFVLDYLSFPGYLSSPGHSSSPVYLSSKEHLSSPCHLMFSGHLSSAGFNHPGHLSSLFHLSSPGNPSFPGNLSSAGLSHPGHHNPPDHLGSSGQLSSPGQYFLQAILVLLGRGGDNIQLHIGFNKRHPPSQNCKKKKNYLTWAALMLWVLRNY